MNEELIPGNVDPKVMIPKHDLQCYIFVAEKRIHDPANPLYPIIRKRLMYLRPIDYKTYFCNSEEKNIHYLKTMALSSCSLVWDPCLPGAKELSAEVQAAKEAAWEASGDAAFMRHKAMKKKATIEDVQNMLKDK
jgi:hypothetical protein